MILVAALAGTGCTPTVRRGTPVDQTPVLTATAGSSRGLQYGQLQKLEVLLTVGANRPVPGARVDFSLSGDALGATLSSDHAITSALGVASVDVAAGAAEATFKVTVSSDGAADLSFDVAVSRYPFVSLDARVQYSGTRMGQVTAVSAYLYDSDPAHPDPTHVVSCADFPATMPPPPSKAFLMSGGNDAIFSFGTLSLVQNFALVGRATDGKSRLLGYGCVDIGAEQLAQTGVTEVAIPLGPVRPELAGAYLLSHTARPSASPSPVAAWSALTACPAGPAQPILDAIVVALGNDPVAAAIQKQRAVPDNQGCRGLTRAGSDTLDSKLRDLLGQGSVIALLPGVVADIEALSSSVTIASELRISKIGAEYRATHTITELRFEGAVAGRKVLYDPAALGLPSYEADSIALAVTDGGLGIADHGFALRLPSLWGRAAFDVALGPRNLAADPKSLLQQIVGGAMKFQYTGCGAIDDVMAQALSIANDSVTAACERGLDALAAQLAAAFAPTTGLDYRLAMGGAVPTDGTGDFVVDTLAGGSFVVYADVGAGQTSAGVVSFVGARFP